MTLGRDRAERGLTGSTGEPARDHPVSARAENTPATAPTVATSTPGAPGPEPETAAVPRSGDAPAGGRGRSAFANSPSPVAVSSASDLVILDMCCGSGALGLSLVTDLLAEGIRVNLTAADIEPHGVACARRNLEPLAAAVFHGDLFEPLPADLAGRVDILLANTPYVPSAEIATMPPEARDHEPRVTLDGGPDGLDLLRRIAAAAPHWLAPGGHLLVEESEAQADPAAAIMRAAGLSARVAEDEERGATVVIGTRPD
ncbi:methyltransferase [Nocardia sp. NPDC057668]|uniref:methyltransferase n=1 Tax=Nocardia sp. NPDC057668 TaxID=3346202 RepID=UPI003670BD9F